MKKALISSIEPVTNFDKTTGYRVAQVELPLDIFPVADAMSWVDCDDLTVADQWYFDTTTNTVLVKQIKEIIQPVTFGSQVF